MLLFCIFMDYVKGHYILHERSSETYGDVIVAPSTRRVRIQMNQETRQFLRTAVKGNTKTYVRNPLILVILGESSTFSYSLLVNILGRV
jgi:hypothetical protein